MIPPDRTPPTPEPEPQPPSTVTTPTATSPSLYITFAGEAVIIWGVLEAAGAFANLPPQLEPWVLGIGAVLKIVGEVLKRRGTVHAIQSVEQGTRLTGAVASAALETSQTAVSIATEEKA